MSIAETISKAISHFAGVVDATRAELTSVIAEINAVETERLTIVQAKPHTDDIVAAFLRGLDHSGADFKQQLSTYVASTFVQADDAAEAASRRIFDVLRLEAKRPDANTIHTRVIKGEGAPLNVAVLAYLLRDKIAAEIPELVENLCPAARDGMKAADRAAALKEIDARLDELRAKRDALNADLAAARVAAGATARGAFAD